MTGISTRTADLRVALVSGNYNMVRDGPTQALNRLVGFLLREGARVLVFSPTVAHPQVEATGELVSVPSFALPGREEYRLPLGLYGAAWNRFCEFAPNIIHVASPDFASRHAAKWGRDNGVPVLASVHTRFETYPRYYGFRVIEPAVERWLKTFYLRADGLVAPAETMRRVLIEQGMHSDIGIWSRGVDRTIFNPDRRDMAWRRGVGIADDELAVGFLGRIVMEKGLGVFADTVAELVKRGVKLRVLVVGDGPARDWFAARLPADAVFTGLLSPPEIGSAVAGMDVMLNPSDTETFGNVTLEAMACAVPVAAARATGSDSLVVDGESGRLVDPGDVPGFADALGAYGADPALRIAHGRAGEERSLAFDWEHINRSMAETYLRLIRQKAGKNQP